MKNILCLLIAFVFVNNHRVNAQNSPTVDSIYVHKVNVFWNIRDHGQMSPAASSFMIAGPQRILISMLVTNI
jgi:hypothetical protein